MGSDGTVKGITYTKDGGEAKAMHRGRAVQLFTLELQESLFGMKEGKRRTVPLNVLSQKGDRLLFGSAKEPNVRIVFEVQDKKDYMTIHLVQVETPQGEHATSLTFQGVLGFRAFPLHAEVMTKSFTNAVFHGLLRRSPRTNLGGVALWFPETKELDDEILYQVWVNEKLPHPKVKEEWTVARAKQWVADYIEEFRNYSEIYVTGNNLDELKRCVDHAASMKMANIYMHLTTWAGRYHTEAKGVYDLNSKLFPNGHASFKELCDYAKSKGLGVGIRTLSNSISLKSEEYIGKKPDKRLGHFWRGTLVKTIGPNDTALTIKSDKTIPTSFTKRAMPSIKFLLIDDEIVQYDKHEEHPDGSITLQVARERGRKFVRGYGPTEPAAHQAGTPVNILNGHFKDHVAPDHDSELMEIVAQRYADFNNKMELSTSSFDGLYLYTFHTPYGNHKLLGSVYSKLDHPTFCTTSNGIPTWGFFEIRFNSVRKALGLKNDLLKHGTRVPGRMRLMIGLHQDQWPAPSPYGHTYCIVPHAVASHMWCSVQDQSSTHQFTPEIFEEFGFLDHFTTAIERWRKYGPQLPIAAKQRIWSAYAGGSGRYPFQVEHFRFEENGKDLDVVPFRPMRRKDVDRGWAYIQEHGPVYTYQYIRPNTAGLVQAENPYHSQVPEFIIRVIKDFDRKDANPSGQHQLMIPLAAKAKKARLKSGKMILKQEQGGARISYKNSSRKTKVLILAGNDELVNYNVGASIKDAKGLGMTIHGDGSNAMFVVQIAGKREYGVKIDFTGKRYIEIPDPQVCWSDARIPLDSRWKRWWGYRVTRAAVGFSSVPANTNASVLVEDIRLLPEKDSSLVNPIVHCGSGTIKVTGVIPSDRYLWYKSGAKAQVYDLNWNKVGELPVQVANAEVSKGRSDIRIQNNNKAGDPWLEVQFFVKDKAIHQVTGIPGT
jgi:hypothetical protein